MIANARMYSVTPEVGALWRTLLSTLVARSGLPVQVVDHAPPAAIEELWRRPDKGAVFMCGLPFSLAEPQPVAVAAPLPSPGEFAGRPQYFTDFVVRRESAFHAVADTFGHRLALTVPNSQSGCLAALTFLMAANAPLPLFGEVIEPTITPLGALTAVLRGTADIAPIDGYALRLLQRYRPDLATQLRSIGRTDPTPIPLMVASRPGIETLQAALLDAHRRPSTQALLDKLLLAGFARPEPRDYAVLRDRFAAATRYWGAHPLAARVHPAFAAYSCPG